MSIGVTLLTKDSQTAADLAPFLKKQGYNLLNLNMNAKSALPPGCMDADLVLYEALNNDHSALVHTKELIEFQKKPVIILARNLNDLFKAEFYRLGVQDLIMAPWFYKVVDMRIKQALQREGYREKERPVVEWQLGNDILIIESERHRAFINGEELKLTFSQWNILSTLVGNGGVALSRNYLLRECLHFEQGDTRTLDNHIKNIRKVLGSSDHIETMHGYGYKLNGRQVKKDA